MPSLLSWMAKAYIWLISFAPSSGDRPVSKVTPVQGSARSVPYSEPIANTLCRGQGFISVFHVEAPFCCLLNLCMQQR